MLKIGEFAQLSQVTVKALHHYDEVGLLHPAHVDPHTKYRYYTVEQLPRIHRIMALRELGLSLEQIGHMLDAELPVEQIRGILRLKQAEYEEQIQVARRQQAMINFRLHMIEAEAEFPQVDVVTRQLEPLRALSHFVPSHASEEAALRHMRTTSSVVNQAIADGTIDYTGISIDVFHGETILPFHSPELSDVQHEILLGVSQAQESLDLNGVTGGWMIKEEPAIPTALTLVHYGSSDPGPLGMDIVEKVTLVRRWAVSNGYEPRGYVRFLHIRGPLDTPNMDEFIMEVQLPVEVRTS